MLYESHFGHMLFLDVEMFLAHSGFRSKEVIKTTLGEAIIIK